MELDELQISPALLFLSLSLFQSFAQRSIHSPGRCTDDFHKVERLGTIVSSHPRLEVHFNILYSTND